MDQTNICEICKSALEEDELKAICVSCDSHFHKEHLQTWLKTNIDCPNCRKKFPFQYMQQMRQDGKIWHNPALQKSLQKNKKQESDNLTEMYLKRIQDETCVTCDHPSRPYLSRFTKDSYLKFCSPSHLFDVDPGSLRIILLALVPMLTIDQPSSTIKTVLSFVFFGLMFYLFVRNNTRDSVAKQVIRSLIQKTDQFKNCQYCGKRKLPFWSIFASDNVCSFKHLTFNDTLGSVIYVSIAFYTVTVLASNIFWTLSQTLHLVLILLIPGIMGFRTFIGLVQQIDIRR